MQLCQTPTTATKLAAPGKCAMEYMEPLQSYVSGPSIRFKRQDEKERNGQNIGACGEEIRPSRFCGNCHRSFRATIVVDAAT